MTTWKLKGAGLVLFCAMDVHAASQYTLNYDFNSSFAPGIITATFNGVAQGNRITNLSNISVWFNGQPFNGNGSLSNFAVEYAYSYDPFSGFYLTPNYLANQAVISFDGLENNFIFTNLLGSPSSNAFPGVQSDLNSLTDTMAAVGFPGLHALSVVTPSNPFALMPIFDSSSQTWAISESHSVDEPSVLWLLSLGLVSLAILRKSGERNR